MDGQIDLVCGAFSRDPENSRATGERLGLDLSRCYPDFQTMMRSEAALPDDHSFEPLMMLYLTEATDPDDVEAGFKSGAVTAVKLYPAGATTNSQSGVRDIE